MHKGVISVIIPAYRATRYISQALESVRKQTYPGWEIVVAEDGGRDKTEEIVNEFARSAPENRVKFISHGINKGVAAARNTAKRHAEGEYIAFLDHDDIWKERHLEESIKTLAWHKADISYSTVLSFDDTGAEIGTLGPRPEELETFPRSLYFRNYIATPTVVLRTASIERVGCFDEKLRIGEDYDYWIRMQKSGLKFVYIKEIYCLRRMHRTSLTRDLKTTAIAELYIMEKHRDWGIVPEKIRIQRIADIYGRLEKIRKETLSVKSAVLLLCAWLRQTFSVFRVRRLVKHFISAIFGGRSGLR